MWRWSFQTRNPTRPPAADFAIMPTSREAEERMENVKYLILEAVSDNTDMCDISDIRPGA